MIGTLKRMILKMNKIKKLREIKTLIKVNETKFINLQKSNATGEVVYLDSLRQINNLIIELINQEKIESKAAKVGSFSHLQTMSALSRGHRF